MYVTRKVICGRSIRLDSSLHSSESGRNFHSTDHLKLFSIKYTEIYMKEQRHYGNATSDLTG